MKAFSSVLSWAKRNERWLSSVFFLGGFIGDIIAFTLLEVGVVNVIFAVYLALGAAAILLTHFLFSHPKEAAGIVRRTLLIVLPLFVQYAVGAILSGSLVFYTKSAVLTVSWPFLLLIALVFFGNEYFRGYREHLAFQATLFFFGLYSYVIFALPLFLGRLGPEVFLMSSAIAAVLYIALLYALSSVGRARFAASVRLVAGGGVALLVLMNGAYFTGAIPPLPLGLKDVGIYEQVAREGAGYRLEGGSTKEWWEVWKPAHITHAKGTPLYAYSAVFAPIRFAANVEHVWEHYDGKRWTVMNRVSFPVSGGRKEGYRGYSMKSDPAPGLWRLSVQTGGQTIGRYTFEVLER